MLFCNGLSEADAGRHWVFQNFAHEVDKDGVAQCKGSQPGDQRSYNVQIGR